MPGTTTSGARRRAAPALLGHARERHRPLSARTLPSWALGDDAIDEAFLLFRQAYEGADRTRFEHDLAEKQLVIVLEDESRRIRGFSTVLLQEVDSPRGRATVVFSGDTVIHPEHWGQKRLQWAFARLLLRLRLERPLQPLFWFLIAKGYRTYLLLANAFPRAVPRCDRPDDAAMLRLRDALATSRFGEDFDPTQGIVRYASPHERVRDGLAPITDALLDNPHVRFFAERNPGHVLGDELVCLAEVRLSDLARFAARTARHRLAPRSSGTGGARGR
jgi:hypothetical protein